MPSATNALELRDVGVRYGAVRALEGIDLTLARGEVVALVGPSGCGKTSLLRAVAGLAPTSGSVAANGTDLKALPTHRRGVGVVFQDHALFPHLDVAGNVAFGLVEARVPANERRARVRAWLERVGLASRMDARVDALSGGERQRIALARALAPEPALVLLDEPFASLDPGLRGRLSREVAALLRADGTAALFVTHDLDEALEVGDRVGVLRAGRLVQVAAPAPLIDAPTDPWTARFLGHANVWTGASTAHLPGAPVAALLHEGRVRWSAEPAVDSTPARVAAVARRREGWRLTLDVPAWGVAVEWSAAPREFVGGRPPAVGQAGHLTAPAEAWTVWTESERDDA
ncbi:MAG: ABC transporter ATP-binding protein [Trueperaceae bacterium]